VVIKKAIRQCKDTIGVIHHSDRGFQYGFKEYVGLLKKNGIIISMGQVGYCYDNAMAERVNGILKDEYLLDQTFKNERLAGLAVDHAVKAYNEKRPHWSLNLKMPENVHQETKPNLSTNKCG
jgi:transposase InsO family protein